MFGPDLENNCDMVSSYERENFRQLSDHMLVTANTTFMFNQKKDALEERFLCSNGFRYKSLDYAKAPWPVIEHQLGIIDWQPMEDIAKHSPDEA